MMKKLVILLTPYLALAAINHYPSAETLIYSQIDQILSHENHTDPALVPCLEVANDFVLGGLFVKERKAIVSALFPSPTGKSNWTVQELTNAAVIIINRLLQTSKISLKSDITHQSQPLTLEELDSALESYPLPHKVDKSDDFINLHILETLHTVFSEAEEGKFDLKKDTLKLLVPAVDISMWASADIKKALDKNSYTPKLLHYLRAALATPLQSLDNGKTYCVVTPVGVIPHTDPYYYIPRDTKDLIKMAKNNFTLLKDYNKIYMPPTISYHLDLLKYH